MAIGRNLVLVLFDLDDTLCDYQRSRDLRLRRAFGEAFARSHAPRPDFSTLIAESIAIHAHGTEHFSDLLLRHGVIDPDAREAARTWYLTNRFLGLRLFPDALPTLRTLRATPGVAAIGLVTNGPAIIQREKIALLGLDPEVDFCIISGEVGFEKPDPRIFAISPCSSAAVRARSARSLVARILLWFLTIPRRCLNAEGDLFEQRRLKIEPLLAAIPAVMTLTVLAFMISRNSDIDKFETYASFLAESQQFDKAGKTDAAMIAALRSCLETATPDNRYNAARLFAKSPDRSVMARGYRLIRYLASQAGGNQADAHLFIADEILRQVERDPNSNRNLFYRYLSELRAGFERSPNRYDILERLAEGLLLIGEDRSLTGLLAPTLEFWPHGHFYLAQVAFGNGDDALQKTHALAMVRHFRSSPAELEADQKYRIRFAISLALAGEFSEAESFVRQLTATPGSDDLHKSLTEKIDLIRIITRINEFPNDSDQDIEVLGSMLEAEDLSQSFEAAVKRQLLRKGPLRPALVKLCRNLHATRKEAFDSDDYVFWASILRQNQQNDEAREFLERAVKLSPENDIASNNLANLLYKLEPLDLDRALSLCESVLKRNPKLPTFLETRGQVLAKLGRDEEAIADLAQSLEAFPNVPEIHETLARCYRKVGNPALADAHQKRFEELKSRPESRVSKAPGTDES